VKTVAKDLLMFPIVQKHIHTLHTHGE